MTSNDTWPALPLDAWQDTFTTLHMWTQIVGKLALAKSGEVESRGVGAGP
jgi:uncharacterized protein DUF5996